MVGFLFMSCERGRPPISERPKERILSQPLAYELSLFKNNPVRETYRLSEEIQRRDALLPGEDPFLVTDALHDIYAYYGHTVSRYAPTPRILEPLRLAQTPYHEPFDPTVTAIRLLQRTIPKDLTHEYGEAVSYGVSILTPPEFAGPEEYAAFMEQIKMADQQHPELSLAATQARIMIHDMFDPLALPPEIGINEERTWHDKLNRGYQYEALLPHLFTLCNPDHAFWQEQVHGAIHLSRDALINRSFIINHGQE